MYIYILRKDCLLLKKKKLKTKQKKIHLRHKNSMLVEIVQFHFF